MLGKLFGKISSAFKTAFFILLSLQIAAGCIWGVYNCTSLRMFGDTTLLLLLAGAACCIPLFLPL